jgi:hypothetical protein
MADGKKMIIGKKGVTYGLQAAGRKSSEQARSKPSVFGSFEGEDALAADKNAAVRAQQGVKRSDAKVGRPSLVFAFASEHTAEHSQFGHACR